MEKQHEEIEIRRLLHETGCNAIDVREDTITEEQYKQKQDNQCIAIKQLLLLAEKRVLIREAKWFHSEIYKISQDLDIGEKDNPLIPECVANAYENIKARLREYGITKEQLKSGGG